MQYNSNRGMPRHPPVPKCIIKKKEITYNTRQSQVSPNLIRSNAGHSREEERAITEHQVRGTHWTEDGTRRSTRTSGSRGATPVHRVAHDSENESSDSFTSDEESNEMDGPKNKHSGSSNSSDLSLPPLPTTHELDCSPPKRPPGHNPPPPIGENTVRQQNNKHIQFQTQSTDQTSLPRRQSGNSLPQEGVRTSVAPTATGF